jgi:CBS domain-containing protein
MSNIRHIMSKIVVSVRPDATLMDAIKMLTRHRISGAPVVTAQGEVVGFISDENLHDVLFDESVRNEPVAAYMTTDVHTVDPQDPISTAAKLLAMYGVRRLPVVDHGRFVGVITRRDLFTHVLRHPEPLSEPLFELIPSLGECVTQA